MENDAFAHQSFLYDDSRVSDNASVYVTHLRDNALIYGNADVRQLHVTDSCCVFGNAKLVNNTNGNYRVVLAGDCKFGGNANFDGLTILRQFVKKYGENCVSVEEGIIKLTDVWDMG